MADNTTFDVSKHWPHYNGPTVHFDKQSGQFYRVENGQLVQTQNPLTANLPAQPAQQKGRKR